MYMSYLKSIILITCLTGLISCEKDPWKWDTGRKNGVTLLSDTLHIWFSEYDDSDWATAFPQWSLVGMPADYDREFKVVAVDSGTNIPSDNYRVEATVVKAGEWWGFLEVSALRPAKEYEEGHQHVTLQIVENEHFAPTMKSHIYLDIHVQHPEGVPRWWDKSIFGEYSETVYKLYFRYYDRLPETYPLEWKQIFEPIYGRHMEAMRNSQWMGSYLTFLPKLKTCVLVPMFDYCMQHPEMEIDIPQWYKDLK